MLNSAILAQYSLNMVTFRRKLVATMRSLILDLSKVCISFLTIPFWCNCRIKAFRSQKYLIISKATEISKKHTTPLDYIQIVAQRSLKYMNCKSPARRLSCFLISSVNFNFSFWNSCCAFGFREEAESMASFFSLSVSNQVLCRSSSKSMIFITKEQILFVMRVLWKSRYFAKDANIPNKLVTSSMDFL